MQQNALWYHYNGSNNGYSQLRHVNSSLVKKISSIKSIPPFWNKIDTLCLGHPNVHSIVSLLAQKHVDKVNKIRPKAG